MTAQEFEFVSYQYTLGSPEVSFNYRVLFSDADVMDFTEKITLSDAYWSDGLSEDFIKNILQDIHLILGISYYKLFCPPKIATNIQLSKKQALFWNVVYTKGLSEFLYRNNLPLDSVATFPSSGSTNRISSTIETNVDSFLVGIGGGKDSIVALEFLKEYDCTGFIKSDGYGDHLAHDVAAVANVPLCTIQRELDTKLLTGIVGAYEGHVPISAVYAFLGVFQAALTQQRYFVVANEYSSNFGNLVSEGNEVNHKWSGSHEFEILFQEYIRENLTPDIGYFSITRPLYELRVVKHFVERGEKYFDVFSSCNRNFAHNHDMEGKRWCGECSKCAFSFLMLAAFLEEDVLLRIFKKNLFEDAQLLPTYRDLLGLGGLKPFDCVGTFDESKVALQMAAERFSHTLVVQEYSTQIGETTDLKKEVFSTQKAKTIPSQFRFLGMESVLILGYGKEGHVTEQYLKEKYPKLPIGIADKKDDTAYLEKQTNFDIVVKTPVIPNSEVTKQCVTATQLFFAEVPHENIIGVTGSKGKSTTATLLYQMLKEGGKKVRLVGNIGTPALESVLQKPADNDELFVFELSSYQLEDLDVSPHVSVVTSLFPEHLDHHGSLEAYYVAKQNIVRFQTANDMFVYQPDFPVLQSWAENTHARTFVPESVPFEINNSTLLGNHNVGNTALAYTVAKMYGITDEETRKAVECYEGLPHRLQNIGVFKGITFYDDSISTTPESTIAGLRAIDNVQTLILGGVDRGYNFSSLEDELHTQGVQTLILFPESGTHILSSEDDFTVLHTQDMDEAIAFAYEHTPEGSICLLSPAAPSYNLFTNFEERGAKFIEAVKKYGKI